MSNKIIDLQEQIDLEVLTWMKEKDDWLYNSDIAKNLKLYDVNIICKTKKYLWTVNGIINRLLHKNLMIEDLL